MARPTKSTIQARKAAERSRELRVRRAAIAAIAIEAAGVARSRPLEPNIISLVLEQKDIQVVLSDSEDEVPIEPATANANKPAIGQPEKGWKAVENRLYGNSHFNANKYPQSRYYYRQKQKVQEKEGQKLAQTYGSIARFFKPAESAHTAATAPPTQVRTPHDISEIEDSEPELPLQLELISKRART